MSLWDCAAFIVANPAVAARAFNETVQAFIDIVLMGNGCMHGLFGKCNTYYGMVEAQRCGTLHVHFLVWLEGNPNL